MIYKCTCVFNTASLLAVLKMNVHFEYVRMRIQRDRVRRG